VNRACRAAPRWLGSRQRGTLSRIAYCTVVLALGLGLVFVANWCYQVARKPTELLAPFSLSGSRSHRSTWESYGSLFREHSTDIISPELLAALAQVESHGNPLVRTYWRWRWSWNPFEIYAPASSAVGMLQITDDAFVEAKRYCIHNHRVVQAGPWHDLRSCWFNGFYSRLIPSHAVEMTAARLHHVVVELLHEQRISRVTLEQKEELAAVVHLCGRQRGTAFVRRGFRLAPRERCGSHDASRYLARVTLLKRRLAGLEPPQ